MCSVIHAVCLGSGGRDTGHSEKDGDVYSLRGARNKQGLAVAVFEVNNYYYYLGFFADRFLKCMDCKTCRFSGNNKNISVGKYIEKQTL